MSRSNSSIMSLKDSNQLRPVTEVHHRTPQSKPRWAIFVALLMAVIFAVPTAAQAPQDAKNAAGIPAPTPPRSFPLPTNLKVLPKDLTGAQVHDIMQQWEGALGIQCGSCHAKDFENVGPDGRPSLNFADDSKPMKAVARLMYTMTDQINTNYIAKVEGSGVPVTCGTCHRGHVGPEPFVIAPASGPTPAQIAPPAQ